MESVSQILPSRIKRSHLVALLISLTLIGSVIYHLHDSTSIWSPSDLSRVDLSQLDFPSPAPPTVEPCPAVSTLEERQRAKPLHPILIFQHIPTNLGQFRALYQTSREGHERYANDHGYLYQADHSRYLPPGGSWERAQSNKGYAVLRAVIDELAREDSVEWIFATDSDTLITDPRIAIHDMLPPRQLDPQPWFIGNQDQGGFNAGVTIIRVCPETVQIMGHALAFAPLQDRGVGDQGLLALTFQSRPDYAAHFYQIPMRWYNMYPGSQFDPGGEHEHFGKQRGTYTPEMQIHLVAGNKNFITADKYVTQAEQVYADAAELARTKGVQGHGLDLDGQQEKAREAAERWWKEVKSGIEGVVWNIV